LETTLMGGPTHPIKTRKRHPPEERRRLIIESAIEFFSKHGFDGSTHQLATYIGVTQPLIYQYFPTKDDLIEAVYETLFVNRWKDEWDVILSDRSRKIENRLIEFYTDYAKVVHEPNWTRVFLYSGLRGLEINRRYTSIVAERAIRRICIEVRDAFNFVGLAKAPLSVAETESAWMLHASIFYYGVRRFVYQLDVEAGSDELIRTAVTLYLRGVTGIAENNGLSGSPMRGS
jgi:AcrR family transcriptional regulator